MLCLQPPFIVKAAVRFRFEDTWNFVFIFEQADEHKGISFFGQADNMQLTVGE